MLEWGKQSSIWHRSCWSTLLHHTITKYTAILCAIADSAYLLAGAITRRFAVPSCRTWTNAAIPGSCRYFIQADHLWGYICWPGTSFIVITHFILHSCKVLKGCFVVYNRKWFFLLVAGNIPWRYASWHKVSGQTSCWPLTKLRATHPVRQYLAMVHSRHISG